MNSRSRRDAALKNVEALILAQAVWEHGTNSWPVVARILSKHPLISRPKSFFTPQSSHIMYENLMKEAGIKRPSTEASNAAHSAENKTLAEIFYRARVEELRDLIIVEETKFKSILSEIETIRSGNFDAEITARITGLPLVSTEPGQETKASEPTSDEVFGGSELSGVTVTPASPSQSREGPFEESEPLYLDPTATDVQGEPIPVLEEPPQPPTTPDVSPPSPSIAALGEGEVEDSKDAGGEGNEEQPIVHDEPSEGVLPGSSNSLPTPPIPKAVPEACQEEDHRTPVDVDDQEEQREEEEEEEDAVEKEAKSETPKANDDVAEEEEEEEPEGEEHKKEGSVAESPGQELDVTETPAVTAEPMSAQENVPLMQEPPPESPAVPEVEAELAAEDGESSGEEPLHVSRRSTRRRRSTLSPVQPLQTRGKARRQRAESPPIKAKEEPEADHMDEVDDVQEGTPNAEIDQDASPAPVDFNSRRREGKRKVSVTEGVDSPRDRKRPREDSEPADEDEPGPSSHALRGGRRQGTRSEEQVALKRFQNVIGMLHSQISQHRNGNIFHNPIKNSEAPDYHEIVKRPIDLKTIKIKVKDGSIANSLEYQRDIFLMFANAMMYNRPGSDVYTMAEDMMIESEGHISAFRQTEGLVRGAHRA
ncbi:hypothetical protein D9615_000445 [Tricholomella constricta]|uniref:Bromo domain-containing protein n=1 Tax=Tricholomella constricta TaxID=117010 RepID=A0A8H5HRI3_9AGAR|nr:hypothetical protein D9615_000445 [Tricholomella constricta]